MGPSQQQQQQQQQLTNIVSKVTQIQEELVEQEIEKYDNILKQTSDATNHHNTNDPSDRHDTSDPVLQQWRQKRMQEYQARQDELRQCRQTPGHGEYTELGQNSSRQTIDVAQEFFQTCQASTRVIIHCYRPTTELCQTFHEHLQSLATTHIETRFLKFNVQDYDNHNNDNPNIAVKFLIERLQIRVMPTLILIQNQQILHRMEGCTELNNTTRFSTHHLAYVLGHKYRMIYPNPDEIPDPVGKSSSSHQTSRTKSSYLTGSKGTTRHRYRRDEEEDEEEDF